jgi:hypothetical protein
VNNNSKPEKTRMFIVIVALVFFAPVFAHADVVTVIVKPSADAYVDSEHQQTNYGGSTDLRVVFQDFAPVPPPNPYHCISYLKFNLSGIPQFSTILSAELWLSAKPNSCTNPMEIRANMCNPLHAWEENTVTYANGIPYYNNIYASSTGLFNGGLNNWDVTDQVAITVYASSVYGPDLTIGMDPMRMNAPDGWSEFYSREASNPLRPYLEIHYEPPAPPAQVVDLSPLATKIQPGGCLEYDVTVTNNESTQYSGWAWAGVKIRGNNIQANPIFGPYPFTLQPVDFKTCRISHPVPLQAPLGDFYELFFNIGNSPTSIDASDSFDFEVGYEGYIHDDGSVENLLCWTSGGDLTWMHCFTALPGAETITEVQCIFGSIMYAGYAPGNGTPCNVYVWDDPTGDADPSDAVLLSSEPTVVQNVDTDTYVIIPLTVPATVSDQFYVGCCMTHGAGQYCAPIDMTTPYVAGTAFYCGTNTPGCFDPVNLPANQFPPAEWSNFWCIRAGY